MFHRFPQGQDQASISVFKDPVSTLLGTVLASMCEKAGDTHVEGKLAREVIHATGMHQAEGVAHCFSAQHALASNGADPTIGQSGCHDTAGFTSDLHGAQL